MWVYVMSTSFLYMHKSDMAGNCLNSSEPVPLIRTGLKLLSDKKGMCQSSSGNVFFLLLVHKKYCTLQYTGSDFITYKNTTELIYLQ